VNILSIALRFIMSSYEYYDKMSESRVYELAPLLYRPKNHDEEEPASWFDPEEVIQMIQQSVEPHSWDHEGPTIDISDTRLLVRQTPEVHRRIDKFLQDLRTRFLQTIRVEFIGLACSEEKLRSWLRPDRREPTAEEVHSMLVRGMDADGITRFASLSLAGVADQKVRGAQQQAASYVTGYRNEAGRDAAVILPEVTRIEEGLEIVMTPKMLGERKSALLDLTVKLTRILSLQTVKTTAGELHLPKVASMELSASATLPLERWGIVGILRSPDAQDRPHIVIARARLQD